MESRSSTGSSDPEASPTAPPSSPPRALSLVEVPCVLCGARETDLEATGWDFEYGTVPDEFCFVRCRSCGHRYLNPRPAGSELGRIYPSNYYAFEEGGNALVARLRRSWEGGKVRLYRELVGEGPRRILDVGCGNGRFLKLLRDFGAPEWELVGVDFDPDVVEKCREEGFEAHSARMEEFREGEGSFDAVVMLQLIEHVEDPVEISRRVFALLRPGGYFIVETPNLGGPDYRHFAGRCWGHYHFPRHWNLFSTGSLRRMLEAQGFRIEHSQYLISTSAWIVSLHNTCVDRGLPGWVVRFCSYQNPILLGLAVIIDTIRTKLGYETSNQRVIGRKPA